MELFDQYNNIHWYSLFSICSVVLFACAMDGPMDPWLYYINVVNQVCRATHFKWLHRPVIMI